MTKSTYQIVIDTVYNSKVAKAAKRDFDNFSESVEKGNKRLEAQGATLKKYGMQLAAAGGVLVGVGLAAKKAYEFIGEGAQLSAAAGKFDNLSVSINTTGDALLGKMKTATKGMISDAELIASGTDIMSLGLAKTEKGVVRMASAVGALDLDMQVLALTLANDSTMRLDNLGLSLEDVTTKKKELIASGFIGDAFDEAVLLALEDKMTLLGDASETTAGQMKILEASASNLWDSLKRGAAESEAVQTSISRWSNLAKGLTAVLDAKREAQDDLNAAVAAGIITDEEAIVIYHKAKEGMEGGSEALQRVRNEMGRTTEATEGYVWVTTQYTLAAEGAEQAAIAETEAIRQEGVAKVAAIETSGNYADALYDDAEAATELSNELMAAAFAESALMEAQLATVGVTNSHISVLDGYAQAWGRSEQATQTAAGRQDTYRQNLEALNSNVDIAADKVDNLAMKLLGIPPSVSSTVSVDFGDAFSQIGRLTTALGSLGAARAIAGEGDDVFAGDSSTAAGGPGGNQGQTSSGGMATGGSNAGMSQRIGDTDFDPLAKGASGLDMIVPAGFPNDSYPIAAQSGERVTIQTPQQMKQGGAGNNVTININGGDVAQIRRVLREEGISADSRRRMN